MQLFLNKILCNFTACLILGFLLLVIVIKCIAMYCQEVHENVNSQLGVRPVMIKCEIPEEEFPSDDRTRFQREELLKHNALRDCTQKLAVTIKFSSDPNEIPVNEYIPIDHVVGANKKRIRLLNPYILRLRRKAPCQAYKLRKIDTVRGVIARSYDRQSLEIRSNESRRMQRDLQSEEQRSTDSGSGGLFRLDHNNRARNSYSIKSWDLQQPMRKIKLNNSFRCSKTIDSLRRNLRVERDTHDRVYNYARKWTANDMTPALFKQTSQQFDEQLLPHKILYGNREPELGKFDRSNENEILKDSANTGTKLIRSNSNSDNENERNVYTVEDNYVMSNMILPKLYNDKSDDLMNAKLGNSAENLQVRSNFKYAEKTFALYEIGEPDVWFSTRVQLYEKFSTPEGKTVWNDLTKEATVSTITPEWSNEDVNIRYKSTQFLPRKDFTFPLKGLCLVLPIKHEHGNIFKDETGEFVIVPVDDIITLHDVDNKQEIISSDFNTTNSGVIDRRQRQVIVRTARALMDGTGDKLQMVSRGSNQYLKLPHTKPHYAQIDLEARADDNELILVGVLGRLTTIVADATRRIRSVLTVQATNTGLAAARFKVLARECSSGLLDSSVEKDETMAGSILLPPKYSRNFLLTLPMETSIDSFNCTIALVNEADESIAVRDVRIKRDDRCFCVWYCDCVCLSEDPRLLCHNMMPAQLLAAGLSTKQKSRHARSVCYPDIITLNLFITFIGVLLVLLLIGFVKAFIGLVLRCVASWGLQLFLEMPRKLDRYYESSLRNRRVVYDDEGWPVHPDTKERTVRLVSIPMEFILNLIFFITLPCIIIWNSAKRLVSRCRVIDKRTDTNCKKAGIQKCFSSHEAQGMGTKDQRCHEILHEWMSPHAEELSTGLWQEGLTALEKKTCHCVRLGTLPREDTCFHKTCEQSSCAVSEQEDTEYVLMQMQKSSESLAKSQQQLETKKTTKHR